MRVLHVMPDFPWPPLHGGRVDIWGRLAALAGLGADVDVIATVREPVAAEALDKVLGLARRATLVARKPRPLSLPLLRPLQVASRDGLRSVALEASYDLVILESEYVAGILENRSLRPRRVALRIHNDEGVYYSELARAERSWWRKLYYLRESALFRRWSERAAGAAGELWFISHEEWQRFLERSGRRGTVASRWLPAAVEWRCEPLTPPGGKAIWTGNLFQPNNLAGLQWYVEQVHPRLMDVAGYRLVVAGSLRPGPGEAFVRWLRATPGLEVWVNELDLGPLCRAAAVSVNPALHGGGVKIKALEAIRRGLPLVSTAAGVEGTGLRPGEDFLCAGSAQEMAAAVRRLLSEPALREKLHGAAAAFLAGHYDQRRHLASLLPELTAAA